MNWSYFILFATIAVFLWIVGAWAAWKEKRHVAFVATTIGLAIFLTYIVLMWLSLERPPMRTMGETRLWYSFFLTIGWHYCVRPLALQVDIKFLNAHGDSFCSH